MKTDPQSAKGSTDFHTTVFSDLLLLFCLFATLLKEITRCFTADYQVEVSSIVTTPDVVYDRHAPLVVGGVK